MLLGVAAALYGLAAAWTAFGWGDPRGWVPDLAVGWTFIACGLIGNVRRPESRTGALMIGTGFTWFLGNLASLDIGPVAWLAAHAQYLHRGVLIHCLLSFPSGRLSSRRDSAAVVLGYVAAGIAPIARDEITRAVLGVLLIAVAAYGYRTTIGPARRARALVVRAAVAVGVVLAAGASARLIFPTANASQVVLLLYQAVLCAVAVGLLTGLLRGPWDAAAVTDLVVELTEAPSATLREALARALGDPTIQVGYWLPGADSYVDAQGRPFEVPEAGPGRAVTPIDVNGDPLGVLVHDPGVLDDPVLLGSVTAAARLAAANARLQAEVRAQIAEVQASRRRLVEAGDEERQRLQHRLREGAERRLHAIATALAEARHLAERSPAGDTLDRTTQADRQLRRALDDLHELARGLHPPALEGSGLASALEDLIEQSPVPIELEASTADVPSDVTAARISFARRRSRTSPSTRVIRQHHGRDPRRPIGRRGRGRRRRRGGRARGLGASRPHRPDRGARRDAEGGLTGGWGYTPDRRDPSRRSDALTNRSADLRPGPPAEERLDEQI
jgi:signal transduction histidine kinase